MLCASPPIDSPDLVVDKFRRSLQRMEAFFYREFYTEAYEQMPRMLEEKLVRGLTLPIQLPDGVWKQTAHYRYGKPVDFFAFNERELNRVFCRETVRRLLGELENWMIADLDLEQLLPRN